MLLRDEAYARLRDAILDGTLEAGEQLRDAELSSWLGISRTPIREALARLEDCGLVESAPNRYTRVAPLDRRDAQDAFQVVAALHALAATLGVARVSSAELDAMAAANERFSAALASGDVDAAVAADDAFHDVLVHAVGQRRDRALARAADAAAAAPGAPALRVARRAALGRAARGDRRALRRGRRGRRRRRPSRENWLSLGTLIDRSFT